MTVSLSFKDIAKDNEDFKRKDAVQQLIFKTNAGDLKLDMNTEYCGENMQVISLMHYLLYNQQLASVLVWVGGTDRSQN